MLIQRQPATRMNLDITRSGNDDLAIRFPLMKLINHNEYVLIKDLHFYGAKADNDYLLIIKVKKEYKYLTLNKAHFNDEDIYYLSEDLHPVEYEKGLLYLFNIHYKKLLYSSDGGIINFLSGVLVNKAVLHADEESMENQSDEKKPGVPEHNDETIKAKDGIKGISFRQTSKRTIS